MSDMKTEQLLPGQNPAGLAEGGQPTIGATHEVNTGFGEARDLEPGEVEKMFGPATTPLERLRAAGKVEENPEEMGGGGDIPEIRVPPHIKTIAVTKENLPNASPEILAKMQRKFPGGIPEIRGGSGGVEELVEAMMGLQGRTVKDLQLFRRITAEIGVKIGDKRASLWEVVSHGAPQVYTAGGRDITEVSLYTDAAGHPVTVRPAPDPATGRIPDAQIVNPYVNQLVVPNERGVLIRPCETLDDERATVAFAYAFFAPHRGLITEVIDQRHLRAIYAQFEGSSDVDGAAEALFGFAVNSGAIANAQEHEEFVKIAAGIINPKIFLALRTAAQPIEMLTRDSGALIRRRSGLIHLADYMDKLIGSQGLAEKVLSKTLVGDLQVPYIPRDRAKGGAIDMPGKIIMKIWNERLGVRLNPEGVVEEDIVSSNYYDAFSANAVTVETAGEAGVLSVAIGAEYGRYMIARGLWHAFGLDRISVDGLAVDLPPGRRKAEFPESYVGPTYNLPPAGRAESETAAGFNSFVGEKVLPKTIDPLFDYLGGGIAELGALRAVVGNELPEVFNSFRTLKEAQRAVVERVLTRITVGPEYSQYMDFAVWGMMTKDVVSRQRAVNAYTEWVRKPENGIIDQERAIREMGNYLGYIEGENPLSHTNYLRASDRGGRTYEQWLQRKELEYLYHPSLVMHRSSEMRTLEETRIAANALLPFEQAILNGVGSQPLDFSLRMLDLKMINLNDMSSGQRGLDEIKTEIANIDDRLKRGVISSVDADIAKRVAIRSRLRTPGEFEGYSGMKTFSNRLSIRYLDWRPSIKDAASWLDYEGQRVEIMKHNKNVWRILQDSDSDIGEGGDPFLGTTVSIMKAINKALQGYSDESYNFVPSDEKARMGRAFVLHVLQQICPLAQDSWMLSLMKLRPQRSNQTVYTEMYLPDSMIDAAEFNRTLLPLGYRKFGKFINTPNRYPVRARAKRRDIQRLFSDMSTPKGLRESGMPLTVLGVQFPNLRVPGWKEAVEAMIKGVEDSGTFRPEDSDYIRKVAASLFDSRYEGKILDRFEKRRNTDDFISGILKLIGGR